MTVFSFIDRMKEMSTPVAYIAVGILGLFLIFIIIKMLFGMGRGTWRQLVRTGATLLAAIVSFIAGDIIAGRIVGSLDVNNLETLIQEIEMRVPQSGNIIRSVLGAIDTEMIEYLLLLPATIILIPILTTVMFLVINLIFKIIRAILIKIFKFKKAKTNSQRLGGALLAAVEGLIWVTMVIFPLTGLMTLADAACTEAIDADPAANYELKVTYDEYLAPFTENPVFTFVEGIGADAMTESIATVKIDGKRTNMRRQVLSVAHIFVVDARALQGADFTALTAEEQAALESIVDTLAESPFTCGLMVSTLNTIPTLYQSGLIPTDNLGGGDTQVVIEAFMDFLSQVETDTLDDDLDTILGFYFGFCDSGILGALSGGEDIMAFISDDYNGDRHILTMLNTLSGNERTKGIVDSLYNLVLSAAFSGSGDESEGGEDNPVADVNISDVRDGLNNIVSVNRDQYETEEEYREVLSDTISSTLNDTVGVEIDQETADEIADYVDENFSEQIGELTDEEFNELMFEVIDIYQGYLNGEEINPDDLENLLPGGGSGEGDAANPDHVHTEVVIDAVPASCTQFGSTKGIYCPGCGETILEPTLLPMTDHVYTDKYDSDCNKCGHRRDAECRHSNTEVVRGYAATCSKTGLTDGKKCADCGEILTAQKSISKLNCTEGDWIIDKAPTTTETGAKHTECTVCGRVVSRETIDMIPLPSEGLSYYFEESTQSYMVRGIGTCTDTDLVIPASYEGYPVRGISYQAFTANKNITSVYLPDTIEVIGYCAFNGCSSLVSINLPESLTTISEAAFGYCSSLQSIVIPNGVTIIQHEAFNQCTSLTSVVIGDSVETISYDAFSNCSKLKSVKMGKSVENIYSYAFHNCTSLNGITLPDTMDYIASDAFSGCSSLYRIRIPISVTLISADAFKGCYNLTVECEAASKPVAWSKTWSNGVKNVYWGC